MRNKMLIALCLFMLFLQLPVYSFGDEPDNLSVYEMYGPDSFSVYERMYVIDSNDTLWHIGNYSDDPVPEKDFEPSKVAENVLKVKANYIIKKDHSLWEINSEDGTVDKKIAEDVKNVDCNYPLLILKMDGTLWGMYDNDCGQLGLPRKKIDDNECCKIMRNVKKACAGEDHTVILKTDGSVWTIGSNGYGQLGIDRPIYETYIPQKISENAENIFSGGTSTFVVKNGGTLYRCGSVWTEAIGGSNDETSMLTELADNVKSVANFWGYYIILKNDGSMWMYGSGAEGDYKKFSMNCAEEYTYPFKIADNVVCISESEIRDNETYLLLFETVDGIVYCMKTFVPEEENGCPYKITKLFEGARLAEMADEGEAEQKNFEDMSGQSNETCEAVSSLCRAGIISGVSEKQFAPEKELTRAEAGQLLLKLKGITGEGSSSFSDVSENDWFFPVAGLCKKNKIMSGFEDGTFRGNEAVSFYQFAAMAARALRNEKYERYKFGGSELNVDVPDWAIIDIDYAASAGLITKDEIKGDSAISRAQAAVILKRLYDLI